jgi:hypothetical protein
MDGVGGIFGARDVSNNPSGRTEVRNERLDKVSVEIPLVCFADGFGYLVRV